MIKSLAISPCPNDTFAFHAWIHGLTPFDPPKKVVLEDIQLLNNGAINGLHDISKISFNCLGKILDNYIMLPSGAALGYGCGPKIISSTPFSADSLSNKTIAVPGKDTTAFLLLKILFDISDSQIIFCPYEKIGPLVKSGEVDCGLIIHETRFTFLQEGLYEVTDLGKEWEERFTLPLPLGCIVAKRSLGKELIGKVSNAIQASLQHAWRDPCCSHEYILNHSQDKTMDIIEKHIALYVNEESSNLSDRGIKAISTLLKLGRDKGLFPHYPDNWIVSK